MISAGRVLLMPKGDYDPTATYELLDIVSYNGSSYIAKGATTGNLPTNTAYWQLSAYGGQAANIAGNFAPLETTDYATRAYATDEIFVDKDSELVIATTTINIGDEIEIDSNCELTTVAELLDNMKTQYDALDQRNRKLIGITQLTAQTDLHLLVPGEYYKKLTTFYVTNAPTGINQVPSAVFRLTVEAGLDESGSSLLLTLRTIDGETYTQAYDGSTWSDWKEVGDITDVPTYTGATSISDGVKGLVPPADISERNNYFKGDGTWGALGTAAAKNSTNAVTSESTDLVESGAVYIQTSKAYKNDDATATAIDDADYLPFYDSSSGVTKKIQVSNADFGVASKADKTDLTSIVQTGATATQAISRGKYFYLNGALVRALTNITIGSTFTLNTNYKVVSNGALNDDVDYIFSNQHTSLLSYTSSDDYYTVPSDGYINLALNASGATAGQLRVVQSDGTTYPLFSLMPNSQIETLFVKKGLKLYISNVSMFYRVDFIPLQ